MSQSIFKSPLFESPMALVAFFFPIAMAFENKLTPVFLAGILGGAVFLARPLRPRLWMPLIAGFSLLLLWSLLTAVWSIDAGQSLSRWLRLSLTVGGGILLCAIAASREFEGRRDAVTKFALGFLIASALTVFVRFGAPYAPPGLIFNVIMDMPLLSFGAIGVLAIFVLAATLEERRVSPLVPIAMIAAAAAIVFRGNSTSSVALAVGAVGFAGVYWLGRKAVIALAVALPLLFLSSAMIVRTADVPALAKEAGWTLDTSLGHRLIIWRFVFGKAQERPVLGWGLHASRNIPDREGQVVGDPRYADIMDVTDFWPGAKIEKMPMHPHNATLQTWLELGAVGAVLYSMLYGLCLWAMSRIGLSRTALAAGAAGVLAVFLIGQLSFSAWQSWWLCIQFLAAAFFLFVVRKAAPTPAAGR